MNFRFIALALCLIAATYLLYAERPYSLSSDIAYQGFAARQYYEHTVTTLHSVRLVDPRDLSKNIQFYLTFWTPCFTFLFVLGLKAGLSLGTAARMLTLTLSIAGAVGWVWVTELLHLKGRWRVAGVTMAALYCMRIGTGYGLGTGDLAIYTVAPWYIGGSILLSARLRSRFDGGTVVRMTLFCVALGCVYWLKFSGIFLSGSILCALLLEQLRVRPWPRRVALLAVFALYGAAFVLPVLASKVYTDRQARTDLVQSTANLNPPRTASRNLKALTETAYYASSTLFAVFPGEARITDTHAPIFAWLIRVPGLILLGVLLYLIPRHPSTYLRNLVVLLVVIPVLGYPALTYIANVIFVQAFERCCSPFWIFLELVVFLLISQPVKGPFPAVRYAWMALAATAGVQLFFFLWVPIYAYRWAATLWRLPAYETSDTGLWVPDLSRRGTREIDAQIKSLVRGPDDIVVPATSSERTFGIDMWIELGGRLLPLTTDMAPSMHTHGHEGANYYGTTPFHSSRPLRVILVASNLYGAPNYKYSSTAIPCDAEGCVERIKSRFVQAEQWVKGPDTGGHSEIWIADLK